LKRAPQAVLADVHDGMVTCDGALRDYGVVISDGVIDELRTAKTRRRLSEAHAKTVPPAFAASDARTSIFEYGKARLAHEALFTMELSDVLANLLYTLPPGICYYAKQKMFARIREEAASQKLVRPKALEALWAEVLDGIGIQP
jgi:N-methylhydantoinase B